MNSDVDGEEVIRQSAVESELSDEGGQRRGGPVKAKVRGQQLVGGQDIESDEERKNANEDEYDQEIKGAAGSSDEDLVSVAERAKS